LKSIKPLIELLLLCLLVLTSCSQQAKITPRPVLFPETSPGRAGFMTFNIRYGLADDGENNWAYRRELVFDLLADHAVDVVGLQESLEFQLKEIKQALPGYKSVSASRDDGGRTGEACPILYRSDRFSLADSGTFWFSNTPWKAGSKHWGNEYPRICTWVRLTEKNTSESFYVYNLHLDHQSQNSRLHSMNLLAKEIAKREHSDPVIIMGDFNMDTDNPAIASFRENGARAPYLDVWQHLHPDQPGITTFHAFGADPAGPCLDHIFIDESVKIIEVAIDAREFGGRYPSDHFPVIAYLHVY
jgi:endonuclease/exonuclease/phosphatase family metal-dependent hydrolase